MALEVRFQVRDASGVTVAETREQQDAAIIAQRWGLYSTVLELKPVRGWEVILRNAGAGQLVTPAAVQE